ncbi:MAG TPA: hemerythrin domain-containing protein [Gammaproteobacteria bacterium]
MAQTYRGDENLNARELGRAGQPGMSAHDLLDDDHNRVLQLFNEYENVKSTASAAEKNRIAREICRELKIHTAIEEEIYYPRVIEKADIDDRVRAAENDHAQAKAMIREIEAASTEDASFDGRMQALHDVIRDHISDERNDLFDTAEVMGINTPEMARRLFERKQELLHEMR